MCGNPYYEHVWKSILWACVEINIIIKLGFDSKWFHSFNACACVHACMCKSNLGSCVEVDIVGMCWKHIFGHVWKLNLCLRDGAPWCDDAGSNKAVQTMMLLKWTFGTFGDILGYLGHIRTIWDNSGQFRRLFDESGAFRLFSYSFSAIIGSLKKTHHGRTDPQTDGQTLL